MECNKRAAGQTSPQQPQHCQTIPVPLTPNHESVQPWKICKDKMVELEVVLMPTGTSAYTGMYLEVVQASQNYKPIGRIGFDYRPAGGGNRKSINELLRLYCLRDRGRVMNPWTTTNTTQLTAINITVQAGQELLRVYQQTPGPEQQHHLLVAEQRCPQGVSGGFPYPNIKLSCQVRQREGEGGGCGEVFSAATSEYRKVPSSWRGMKINTTKTEVEGNVEVMQADLSFRSLPHNTSWLIKVAYSTGTWIHLSYTPNATLGNHWVNIQCSTINTSDDISTILYLNTTATSPPPRSYLIQICQSIPGLDLGLVSPPWFNDIALGLSQDCGRVQQVENGQHYSGKGCDEDGSCDGGCGRDIGRVNNLALDAVFGHSP
ncbi:hypothetical protein Pmani_006237 [Petrolisthes manimaculis]|uniref:Uncharacterized protein n=1 Tax=Petrolisthes manimaculis TaxID=1843537 RepID=A0AAE1QC69_9EUCA|nr:hypothetical protein Pmani_006237 [Petrolisthes manimaculis]